MALNTKVGSFTLVNAATITVSGVGFTPKAVILWHNFTYDTLVNSVSSGRPYGGIGIGFSNATRNICVTSQDGNNLQGYQGNASDGALCIKGYYVGEWSINSFNASGFSVSRNVFVKPMRINYLALGGSDITNVAVGTHQSPTSAIPYTVTGIAFQPDVLFILNNGTTNVNYQGSVSAFSLGMATSSTEQNVVGTYLAGGLGNINNRSYTRSGEFVASVNGTSISEREVFTGFTVSGFNATKIDGTTGIQKFYLAIKGGRYKVGVLDTLTDYGYIYASGMGFTPNTIVFSSNGKPMCPRDTMVNQSNMSLGAITNIGEKRVSAFHQLYGADPVKNWIADYNSDVYLNVYSGGITALMDNDSFDINGFTNFMADPESPSGCAVFYLGIGELNQPTYKSAYIMGSGYIISPDSDITVSGSWKDEVGSTTSLYASLNDLYNDATYVWHENVPKNAYFEVGLSNPVLTPSGVHILSWRAYKKAGSYNTTLRCDLKQGSGIIVSDTQTIYDSKIKEFSKQLTAGEVSNITNYNDLRIRITVTSII